MVFAFGLAVKTCYLQESIRLLVVKHELFFSFVLVLNDGDVMDDFLSFTASRLPAAVCFFLSFSRPLPGSLESASRAVKGKG